MSGRHRNTFNCFQSPLTGSCLIQLTILTRLHSSIDRISQHALRRGGVPGPGGSAPGGMYQVPGGYLVRGVPGLGGCLLLGGVWSWGVSAPGACTLSRGYLPRYSSPRCEQNS